MTKRRECANCGENISHKRDGARFCTESCRNHFKYHKQTGEEKNNLKGIDDKKIKLPDLYKEKEDEQEQKDNNEFDKTRRGVVVSIDAEMVRELTDQYNEPQKKTEPEIQQEERPYMEPETPLPPMFIPKEIKEESFMYKGMMALIISDKIKREKLLKVRGQLAIELKAEAERNGMEWVWLSTGIGAGAGNLLTSDEKPDTSVPIFMDKDGKIIRKDSLRYKHELKRWKDKQKEEKNGISKRTRNTLIGGVSGLGLGLLGKWLTGDQREKNKAEQVKKLADKISIVDKQINTLNSIIQNKERQLNEVPRYKVSIRQELNPEYQKAMAEREKQKGSSYPDQKLSGLYNSNETEEESQENETEETEEGNMKKMPLTKFKSQGVVSAIDLEKVKYPAYDFKGVYAQFFGKPSLNFNCIIHGDSGEGKSTFCLWVARYLAVNFGRVLYVSGEEGFNSTFKMKLKECKASVPDMHIADYHTGHELLEKLVPNEFHFIILDSLHDMEIKPDMMKVIKEKYKNSAILSINQNNKAGDMIGANEMKHMTDIIVRVKDFEAATTKNRFKMKGEVKPTADFAPEKDRREIQLRIIKGNKGKENNKRKDDDDEGNNSSYEDDRRGII